MSGSLNPSCRSPRLARWLARLALAACAGQAQGYDLLQAWQAASQYDAGLAAAQADYRAGLEKDAQGRALWLPQVQLTGNLSREQQTQDFMEDPSASSALGNSHGYGVKLTQALFDVGRYAGWREGQIRSELARLGLENARQQLMLTVGSAYFAVLQARDALAASSAAKRAFSRQREQALAAFEIGSATITDAHEAQAGYDSAVADEIQAQSELELKHNTLSRLSGLDPLQMTTAPPVLDPHPADIGPLASWLAHAQTQNLNLQSKERELALAEQSLNAKRGAYLPVMQFTAGYQDNRNPRPMRNLNGAARSKAASLGVNLSMGLFDGGATPSQVREAAARLGSARDQLENTRRLTREEVRSAWLGVSTGVAAIRAQQQRLISSQSRLDSTRLGYQVGVRTHLDLLQAQQALTSVEKEVSQTRYRFLLARLQLAQAAGVLDEQTLQSLSERAPAMP